MFYFYATLMALAIHKLNNIIRFRYNSKRKHRRKIGKRKKEKMSVAQWHKSKEINLRTHIIQRDKSIHA